MKIQPKVTSTVFGLAYVLAVVLIGGVLFHEQIGRDFGHTGLVFKFFLRLPYILAVVIPATIILYLVGSDRNLIIRLKSPYRFQDISTFILGAFWILLVGILCFIGYVEGVSRGLN